MNDIFSDTNYMNEIVNTIKQEPSKLKVEKILSFIMEIYESDRAYIFELDKELLIGNNTYEVCKQGIKQAIDNFQEVSFETVPRWADALEKKDPFILNDIESIKEISYKEYLLLKEKNVKNLITVPFSQNDIVGYIGVDNPKKYNANVDILRVISAFLVPDIVYINSKINIQSTKKNENIKNEKDVFVKTLGRLEIDTYHGIYSSDILNSKQCLLFLFYLLINKNNFITIDQIVEIVWPKNEVLEPYQYVKNMVFRTKKALKINDIIVPKNSSYEINKKYNIILDINLIDSFYEEYCNELSDDSKMQLSKKIVELYKGDLFPQIKDVPWIVNLSIKYKKIYFTVLEFILQQLCKKKEYEEMIRICNESINQNPNVSFLHYYIVVAYYESGDILTAKNYFSHAKNIFNEKECKNLENLIFL